ncbi:MAG: peroxiredoxin [Deltaproteobacteria bacterium]|nr:peroxiredoxin [Deltaproteobacteria bacterium]
MVKTEGMAPAFVLRDQESREVRLEDFQGRWVVLYFYPKDGTSGCTREALDFSMRAGELATLDAVIVGISPDSVKSHANFVVKNGLKLQLLSDPHHEVCERYGVWRMKKMCGRESMGVVRSTFLIDPHGIVKKIWDNVKVDGHGQEVHQALRAMAPG